MTTQFQVRKDQIATTRTVQLPDAPLAGGEIRVRIEHFAYTSNNITYAAFGDTMNYWQFFPVAPSADDADPYITALGIAKVAMGWPLQLAALGLMVWLLTRDRIPVSDDTAAPGGPLTGRG